MGNIFRDGSWCACSTEHRMGLAQFAVIPLVFALAQLRCTRLVIAGTVLHLLGSFAVQMHLRWEVAEWVRQHLDQGWQPHIQAVEAWKTWGSVTMHELWIYFVALSETLDPVMDAWTAANSEEMCTASVREKFAAAWESTPLVGHTIGSIGLPGMLLICLCCSTIWQIYEFLRKETQVHSTLGLVKQSFQNTDLDEAATSRWTAWIYMSHMCDVGGLMLLHDIFLKLVQVEIESSPEKIWPVLDRTPSFRCLLRAGISSAKLLFPCSMNQDHKLGCGRSWMVFTA